MMWKEIGKKILEGTLVSVGIKVLADKVVPAAADLSKETWERVKSTKTTKTTGKTASDTSKPKPKPIRTRVVSTQPSRVYDAEYSDTEE